MRQYYEKNIPELMQFIDELVRKIVEKYKHYIDFIILYGSAARGEFVKGSSDIDLVIQLNKKADKNVKEELIKESMKWFWELNEKYNLEFEKVIQTNLIEKVTPLYVPIFVFLPEDVDWINGRFHGIYKAIVSSFTTEKTIFLAFKHEGVVLYGRDIRKEINVKLNKWDKLKLINLPFWIMNGAIMLSFIQPRKSKEYLIKALAYAIQNTAHIYERYDAITMEEKTKVFAQMICEGKEKEIKELLNYKNKVDEVKWFTLLRKIYPILLKYYLKNLQNFRRW